MSSDGVPSPLVRELKMQLEFREWESLPLPEPLEERLSPGGLLPARKGSDAEDSSFSFRLRCS